MKGNQIVSVIIPIYNVDKHLNKCINSILNQTYNDLEVLLVDDGSYDESAIVSDEYAFIDNRIIVVHNTNKGVSRARNIGIDISKGELLSFVDSDDYLEVNTYEYLINKIDEVGCGIINFNYFVNKDENEERHYLSKDLYGLVDISKGHEIVMQSAPFAWNKFFFKKLITCNENLHGIKFKEDIYRGEDTLFIHEVLENAKSIYFDNKTLYHYVQSESSASRGTFRKSQLSGLKLQELYKPLYLKYPNLKKVAGSWLPNLYITLYRDMYLYGVDCKNEMRDLVREYRNNYQYLTDCDISSKEKIKFILFFLSPPLYCLMSKHINKL